jgi:phosphonate transport system substrate-binding protein
MSLLKTFVAAAAATTMSITAVMAQQADGSAENPYRVMLVPADGGTADGTIADFQPIFDAVAKSTGLNFDIKVGQSYGGVIEAICSDVIDIAWFGPASYVPAHQRGCAELLAVDVKGGESVYYSGVYTRKDTGIESLADLEGRSLALGDPNSTSSFVAPVLLIAKAGLDPVNDLETVRLMGSHSASLQALEQGDVDAAGASFSSLNKAMEQGAITADNIVVLAKQELPNPPLAMNTDLPDDVKATLRAAFDSVHEAEGIIPEMIRGYGGKQVDGYEADISEDMMQPVVDALELVQPIREDLIRKASE